MEKGKCLRGAPRGEYQFSSDALLLGRITYQASAAACPAIEKSTGEFGKRMNTMPKFVASRMLAEGGRNATISTG